MTLKWFSSYAPVDEEFDKVSLLLHGDGTNGSTTIVDSSSSPKAVTAVGDAQISTAQSKFGGSSLVFDGNGDYLSTPATSFQFLHKLTDSWTAESWVYLLSSSSDNTIFDTGGASGNTIGTLLHFNSSLSLIATVRQGTVTRATSSPNNIVTLNSWHHIALSYDQSAFRLFVDGTLVGSTTFNTQTSNDSTQSTLKVGAFEYAGTVLGGFMDGYIDDFRITKGVARYTANFTPPTAPFPDLSPSGRVTIEDDSLDVDARQYIINVEEQDGQPLESGVRTAINDFVVGCKADGIWNAIKASCILAGARTLDGALVPLTGGAPTPNNFVSADYDRETGLKGNGSTKYLDTNNTPVAGDLNNFHLSVYSNAAVANNGRGFIGGPYIAGGRHVAVAPAGSLAGRLHSNPTFPTLPGLVTDPTRLFGYSRDNASTVDVRARNQDLSLSLTSTTVDTANTDKVFFAGGYYTPDRLQFYSLGESLDLALLDTRVSNLMTAIGQSVLPDPDASAYIAAVEAADEAASPGIGALESGVRDAINDFVVKCKSDKVWDAIKSSCILAGARTLAGAFVPLKGTAPTNYNFVAGDYDRETGLVGDGSTKYLDSNRNCNADPQNNYHSSVYASTATTSASSYPTYIGAGGVDTGTTAFARDANNGQLFARSRSSSFDLLGGGSDTGLIGASRSTSTGFVFRRSGSNTSYTRTSQTPLDANFFIYNTNISGNPDSISYANARLSFYSIGESLDLALLDTHVSNLITAIAIGAAIP